MSVNADLSGYRVCGVDLEKRWALTPAFSVQDGITSFRQLRYNHDYLIVACKE